MRLCIALLVAISFTFVSRAGHADEVVRLEPADAHLTYIVVPPLVGALSLDGWIVGRFAIGSRELPSPGFGGSVGWKHFLDAHGRRALRFYALGDGAESGSDSLYRFGGGTSLMFRTFNEAFYYAGASLVAEAAMLFRDTPDDDRRGFQLSMGAEVPFFGALFSANPHLFAETGTSALVSYYSVEGNEGWIVEARITVRFDWAFKAGMK